MYCSVMSYASAKVSPNTISKYIALQPLFNLILGLGLHQHEANAAEVGAGALIIAGLMLATGEPEEAGASA